jgi:hypothetical protein
MHLEDEDLWEVITISASQLRVGFSGPFALDWTVIVRMADDYGIPTTPRFYRLVAHMESAMMKAISKEKDNAPAGNQARHNH